MMETKFIMSAMGPINFFLGLNTRQSLEGIFISQEAYTRTFLAKFRMAGDSKVKIPMAFRTKLTPSLDKPATHKTLSINDRFIDVSNSESSRHYVFFFVCYCAKFQENPCEPHMTAVTHVFR